MKHLLTREAEANKKLQTNVKETNFNEPAPHKPVYDDFWITKIVVLLLEICLFQVGLID